MLRKFVIKIITKIKGEEFKLDNEIPLTYFIGILFDRLLMLIRGIFIFRKLFVFIGSDVTIKCKSKIVLGKNVKFSNNVYIDALSIDGIRIGDNVNLGKYCRIEGTGSLSNIGKGLILENGVGLNSNCFIGCAGGVLIKKNTIIGELVTFHSENHNFSDITKPIKEQGISRKGIIIGSGCWIGSKVTILDGVIIGDGCVIAAGSVVTSGKYDNLGIYGGVPAKLIKFRE